MSQLLTPRQAEELHKSIIAYLTANNLTSSAKALRDELNLGEEIFDATTAKKYAGLIEKKWTSVVRLQKKIMELESRNATLQNELESATPTSLSRKNQDPSSWLPKLPARHTLESHRDQIYCVAFHPVFSSLASGSEDLTIKIWDWELGELERTVKGHTRPVLDLDFGGPRGGILLASCSSDLTIKLWDPSDGYKNIRTLPGHDHTVSAVRFVGSNILASASRDKTIRMWDVTTGYCIKTLHGHADWIRDVSPSIDGRYLISGGRDWIGRVWDISATTPETKVILAGHEHEIECCTFAPPASYKYLATMSGLKKPPPATSTAEFMATGARDKMIRLWNAQGQCIRVLGGHDNWVRSVVFHPGGKYLISVADDKSLRCWDLSQDGKCVKKLEEAHSHFISCMRWAPAIIKEQQALPNGEAANGATGVNGTPKKTTAVPEAQIRCVIATGSVDHTVKIFAN